MARHPRLRGLSRSGRHRHRHERRSRPRHRRCRPGRPDDGLRIRRCQRHAHGAQRHDAQPMAARTNPRRLVRRLGSCGRRWIGHVGHRRRRGRFDPDPCRLRGHGRAQGHLRSDPAHPPSRARRHDRHPRVPVALGPRHRSMVRRLQRPRPARAALTPPRRGLGGRARHASRTSCAANVWRSCPIGAPPSCHR